jgi:hypothetical protein
MRCAVEKRLMKRKAFIATACPEISDKKTPPEDRLGSMFSIY